MALEGWDADKFTKQFGRGLYNSVRRAAKVTGADVVQEFREDGLDGVGKKRRQAITFKVRKNNTLAFIDRGHDSRVREYGATIRAKPGKSLRIVTDPDLREHERRDLAKGRARETFIVQGRTGPVVMARRANEKEARPVAVLKRRVVRKPIDEGDKLSTIAERNLKKYQDKIYDLIEDI
ncbi:hypothetical protein [Sagittula sp. MA-2]|jgi:hypothetical protein|uniref:hypothetical protein n=1 Tax=Sagittula sp. MA-2 TaxID=3048007 RepID=UPI0024C3359B|nr:hypothetical protein [Sagittula sp. MA-2]WHZ36493.1 hypothetical protein QNI11_05645 [Sagittula sp. MA-2]